MKKILIVIDMLNDFLLPDGALYLGDEKEVNKCIEGVRKLIDEFTKNGDPVIYTCDNHDNDDHELKLLPAHCMKGTDGARIINGLTEHKVSPDSVLTKDTYNAFSNFLLSRRIHEVTGTNDVDAMREVQERGGFELTLCGVCTSICVQETASAAIQSGYKVVVPAYATADLSPEAHEAALERMEKLYGAKVLR